MGTTMIIIFILRIFSYSVGFIGKLYKGESLRQIPFSHGTFLRHNGARGDQLSSSLISTLIGCH